MRNPPFCPRRGCAAHHVPPRQRWYHADGHYRTRIRGIVRRYRCRCCGRRFSEQSFHLDYYAKREVSYPRLLATLSLCVSQRGIARLLAIGRSTVENKLMRLSREALAVSALLLQALPAALGEDLVFDGFQSFWVSQFFPNTIQLLVGAESQLLYALGGATIGRGGRLTEAQRVRRGELERRWQAERGELERSVEEVLAVAVERFALAARGGGSRPLELRSDEHRLYPRVLARDGLWDLLRARGRVAHRRISARAARTAANPLFAVNYWDRELRKDLAEHVRESTRFARSAHASMERLLCYGAYHNLFKPYRITDRSAPAHPATHAEAAGVAPLTVRSLAKRLLSPRRTFFSRSWFTAREIKLWFRMIATPLRDSMPYLPAYLGA